MMNTVKIAGWLAAAALSVNPLIAKADVHDEPTNGGNRTANAEPIAERDHVRSQRIEVVLHGILRDDENWPDSDERSRVDSRASDVLTTAGQHIGLVASDHCAGREVRLITQVTATLLGDGTTVQIHAAFSLFEGASCNTDDVEGAPVSFTRSVASGGSTRIEIWMPGAGGGDFRGWLEITNRPI